MTNERQDPSKSSRSSRFVIAWGLLALAIYAGAFYANTNILHTQILYGNREGGVVVFYESKVGGRVADLVFAPAEWLDRTVLRRNPP